jgi:adenylyl- and sulfurtransferase ThiI
MSEFAYNIIIFHYNEIGIKSDKVRLRMENQLIRNAAAIYRKFGISYTNIIREFGRIYFYIQPDQIKRAIAASKFVIGLLHFSVAAECSTDIEAISELAVKIFKSRVQQDKSIRSFGVSSRRVKSYPMQSPEISKYIGEKLSEAFPSMKINLNKPDFHLFVEIREGKAFLYEQQFEAYLQGLPMESSKILLGQSFGRFADLIAMIMMMKRGVFVQPIFFNFGKSGSDIQSRLKDKLQYLVPLVPSPLYCLEVSFESIMEKIKRVALSHSISPCWLCFYIRQKFLGQLVDFINDGKIASDEIESSLELGQEVEINNVKKGHVKKKGFFKGVAIGLNETRENYCGTDLSSLTPLTKHPHLILTPCIVFDEENFEYYRQILREMDHIRGSGLSVDSIYKQNEKICSLIESHLEFKENLNAILDSLLPEQKSQYLEELSVEKLFESENFDADIVQALHSIKIHALS